MTSRVYSQSLDTQSFAQISVTPPEWCCNSDAAITATTAPVVVGGISAGGTDTTATAWTAIAFAPTTTEIGAISVRLKKGADVAAGGTIKGYLFTDSGGEPGTDISDATTGQPSIVYTGDIGTSYAAFTFRLPKTGLSPNAVYWLVLNVAVTGGDISVDSAANAGNYLATADDSSGSPGTWTAAAKTGAIVVYGSSGRAVSAYSDNHWAIHGDGGEAGFGGRFFGKRGPGSKSDSVDNYGCGGTSTNGPGVRGSSENSFAGQFISVNGWGAQFQGVGGAQLVATAVGSPAMQTVNAGGGNHWQALDATNGYAVAAQIGPHGDVYGASLQLATAALPTAAVGLAGQIRYLAGGEGAADKLYVCLKAAAGTYSWVQISTG